MKRRRRGTPLRRIGIGLAVLVATLSLVVAVRTFLGEDRPHGPAAIEVRIDRDRASEVLSEYVRWDSSGAIGRDPRPPHLDLLVERYAEPLGLEHRVLDGTILLLSWPAGEVHDHPLLLLSHSDVVPVADDERESWTHPPFDGVVADGYVWGRGTIDDKGATIAQLEAIAALQAAGLRPHRDVLLLISPDEERGGRQGVARALERHGDQIGEPWAVLDEGSFAASDFIPNRTLVPVAVGEKRYVTISLTVVGEAGHSSMPRDNAAPRVLSIALGRLGELEHPVHMLEPTDVFLDRLADHAPALSRMALKNRWLFGPMVRSMLADRPASNAMIRDTHSLTILSAGISDNVVPARARATVNLRLLPGSRLDEVLERIRGAIDDPRVTVEVVQDEGASPIAPIEGEVWTRLEAALASAYPGEDQVIAPIITPGTTDARYFARRGIPSYRYLPFELDANERGRVHGVDERVSIQNLEEAARVYAHLLRYW
ncbi:MAG: M20/M25/M40 family metallo-hydrolase [Sandaracinaceae bacterium]|nr:M20/M25/M40 family metallo-hydrolase [Sandaracinaceae bacterium]